MNEHHLPREEYAGPARIGDLDVHVRLRGHLEPIDGRFHWWGRVAADPELTARHTSGATVALTTTYGSAEGRLTDVDPWGRFRISGLGRPPF